MSIAPYFSHVAPEIKADGSWLTEADTRAHDILFAKLPQLVDVPVLSEEISRSEQQHIIDNAQNGYWCVDPLDGTSNFTQGISHWCISIALIQDQEVKLGVVYDPIQDECFNACDDSPSCIDDSPIQLCSDTELHHAMALIDLKRLPRPLVLELIQSAPYRSHRSFGASALDLCWVAAGRCQLYLHGQQQLWDYAAAIKILHNVGAPVETFQGDTIFQNTLTPSTIIAASNDALMRQWRDYFYSIYSNI
jgi:myo-inositol-1(or 4)-monophosphatase